MVMLASNAVDFKYFVTFITPGRQKQFIQGTVSNNAPIRRTATLMNTNSAFTASYVEKTFCYQQLSLRQTIIFQGVQPVVDFDASGNFHLCLTKMKAMNFQDDIPSNPCNSFKENYLLVSSLTSMCRVSTEQWLQKF